MSRGAPFLRRRGRAALIACAAAAATLARAATVEALVEDAKGRPVADAVVALYPEKPAAASPGARAIIDQVGEEFVPHVSAIRVGTAVSFPNRDDIRHHVYSFSPAKSFELPLYKGTPSAPVVFDRAGEVVLGCNIHDWMVAYVYVLDTPHFGLTGADGRVRLEGLPPGAYDAEARHPRAKEPAEATRTRLRATDAEPASATFRLTLRPDVRRPPGTGAGGRSYR